MKDPIINILKDHPTGDAGGLIPILQKVQGLEGYLSPAAISRISSYLRISRSRIYGVATFYSQFRFRALGKFAISICHGTSCHVNGSVDIAQIFKDEFRIDEGCITPDGLVSLERVACLGCCSISPVISINDKIYGYLTRKKVEKLIKKIQVGDL